MRACVIFNPTARGDRARRFRRHLDMIGAECALKQTAEAGGARQLAAEAIHEGFDTIVAAGGDGTLNETINGMGDVPDGFDRARLGLLPLGTVNVFAKELGIPEKLEEAWKVLRSGKETRIDLPRADYALNGAPERRYFAQLAGAGLDARAIELVNWKLKKKVGPLAYVWAGFEALRDQPYEITAANGSESASGQLVLIGNGRYYGGKYRVFAGADMRDGLLDVCVFPEAGWGALIRCLGMFFAGRPLPASVARRFRTETLTLESITRTPLEADGESIGHLPARFGVEPRRLRVVCPAGV